MRNQELVLQMLEKLKSLEQDIQTQEANVYRWGIG
uniref:Uncharacterized protein n=1 Tax=Arundo donax TaxID=35708 RepID=A0A0A9EQI2_ARUDO